MMDTKLMVDIATGVMDEIGMMADFGERRTTLFCAKLEAAFKEAAAGAPDLRSAIPTWRERAYDDSADPECKITTLMQEEIADLRAALASAAPVEALTDEEIEELALAEGFVHVGKGGYRFARAIEARIKGGAK